MESPPLKQKNLGWSYHWSKKVTGPEYDIRIDGVDTQAVFTVRRSNRSEYRIHSDNVVGWPSGRSDGGEIDPRFISRFKPIAVGEKAGLVLAVCLQRLTDGVLLAALDGTNWIWRLVKKERFVKLDVKQVFGLPDDIFARPPTTGSLSLAFNLAKIYRIELIGDSITCTPAEQKFEIRTLTSKGEWHVLTVYPHTTVGFLCDQLREVCGEDVRVVHYGRECDPFESLKRCGIAETTVFGWRSSDPKLNGDGPCFPSIDSPTVCYGPYGDQIHVRCAEHPKVCDLKRYLGRTQGIPPDDLVIFDHGKRLEDQAAMTGREDLNYRYIVRNKGGPKKLSSLSRLCPALNMNHRDKVFVAEGLTPMICVKGHPSMSAEELIDLVKSSLAFPYRSLNLACDGRHLQGHQSLSSLGVDNDRCVQCIIVRMDGEIEVWGLQLFSADTQHEQMEGTLQLEIDVGSEVKLSINNQPELNGKQLMRAIEATLLAERGEWWPMEYMKVVTARRKIDPLSTLAQWRVESGDVLRVLHPYWDENVLPQSYSHVSFYLKQPSKELGDIWSHQDSLSVGELKGLVKTEWGIPKHQQVFFDVPPLGEPLPDDFNIATNGLLFRLGLNFHVKAPYRSVSAFDLEVRLPYFTSEEIAHVRCRSPLDDIDIWGSRFISTSDLEQVLRGVVPHVRQVRFIDGDRFIQAEDLVPTGSMLCLIQNRKGAWTVRRVSIEDIGRPLPPRGCEIRLAIPSGTLVEPVDISKDSSISDLKYAIQRKLVRLGYGWYRMGELQLSVNGERLQRGTLEDNGLSADAMLDCAFEPRNGVEEKRECTFRFDLSPIIGMDVGHDAPSSCSVGQLRAYVEAQWGFPVDRQSFVYANERLADTHMITGLPAAELVDLPVRVSYGTDDGVDLRLPVAFWRKSSLLEARLNVQKLQLTRLGGLRCLTSGWRVPELQPVPVGDLHVTPGRSFGVQLAIDEMLPMRAGGVMWKKGTEVICQPANGEEWRQRVSHENSKLIGYDSTTVYTMNEAGKVLRGTEENPSPSVLDRQRIEETWPLGNQWVVVRKVTENGLRILSLLTLGPELKFESIGSKELLNRIGNGTFAAMSRRFKSVEGEVGWRVNIMRARAGSETKRLACVNFRDPFLPHSAWIVGDQKRPDVVVCSETQFVQWSTMSKALGDPVDMPWEAGSKLCFSLGHFFVWNKGQMTIWNWSEQKLHPVGKIPLSVRRFHLAGPGSVMCYHTNAEIRLWSGQPRPGQPIRSSCLFDSALFRESRGDLDKEPRYKLTRRALSRLLYSLAQGKGQVSGAVPKEWMKENREQVTEIDKTFNELLWSSPEQGQLELLKFLLVKSRKRTMAQLFIYALHQAEHLTVPLMQLLFSNVKSPDELQIPLTLASCLYQAGPTNSREEIKSVVGESLQIMVDRVRFKREGEKFQRLLLRCSRIGLVHSHLFEQLIRQVAVTSASIGRIAPPPNEGSIFDAQYWPQVSPQQFWKDLEGAVNSMKKKDLLEETKLKLLLLRVRFVVLAQRSALADSRLLSTAFDEPPIYRAPYSKVDRMLRILDDVVTGNESQLAEVEELMKSYEEVAEAVNRKTPAIEHKETAHWSDIAMLLPQDILRSIRISGSFNDRQLLAYVPKLRRCERIALVNCEGITMDGFMKFYRALPPFPSRSIELGRDLIQKWEGIEEIEGKGRISVLERKTRTGDSIGLGIGTGDAQFTEETLLTLFKHLPSRGVTIDSVSLRNCKEITGAGWSKVVRMRTDWSSLQQLDLLGTEVGPLPWFEKMASADCAWAYNHLGMCYDTGQTVRRRPAEAMRFFKAAAKREYKEAKARLEALENEVSVNAAGPMGDWTPYHGHSRRVVRSQPVISRQVPETFLVRVPGQIIPKKGGTSFDPRRVGMPGKNPLDKGKKEGSPSKDFGRSYHGAGGD